jgi:hypothetical protein
MILVAPKATVASAARLGPRVPIPDTMAVSRMKSGWLYGAEDDREPAGAAIGY